MPSLSKIMIEQQLGAIGIETTPAKMHISMSQLMMQIKTESAKMEIDRKAPTFRVNRKKINSESGLKPSTEFTAAFRDKGKSAAFRAMKSNASDGNFLANVTRRGDRVVQLARSKAHKTAQRATTLGLMPQSMPEIAWDKGYLRVNWSKHSIVIDWEGEYMPQITVDPPYSIEVYLRNKPYFRVMVEEGEDPNKPGRHIDEML